MSWTGAYAGLSVGYGSAQFDHSFSSQGHYNSATGDTFNYGGSSAIAGGQLGYNWQAGAFVYGLEASLSSGVRTGAKVSPFFPGSDTWSSRLEWLGSLTPRIGFASGNVLVYGKGGIAFTSLREHVEDPADYITSTKTLTGWTVGTGLEVAFARNWTIGAEYNYYNFGSVDVTDERRFLGSGALVGFSPGNWSTKATAQTGTLKLNYRF